MNEVKRIAVGARHAGEFAKRYRTRPRGGLLQSLDLKQQEFE